MMQSVTVWLPMSRKDVRVLGNKTKSEVSRWSWVQVPEEYGDENKDKDGEKTVLALLHQGDPNGLPGHFVDVSNHAVKNPLSLRNLIRCWSWR